MNSEEQKQRAENSKDEAKQLREILFNRIKSLNDPNADLDKEIKRSDATSKLAANIINSQRNEITLLRMMNPVPAKETPLSAIPGGKVNKRLSNGK